MKTKISNFLSWVLHQVKPFFNFKNDFKNDLKNKNLIISFGFIIIVLGLLGAAFFGDNLLKNLLQPKVTKPDYSYSIALFDVQNLQAVEQSFSSQKSLTSVVSFEKIPESLVSENKVNYNIFKKYAQIDGSDLLIQTTELPFSGSGSRSVSVPQNLQPAEYEFKIQNDDTTFFSTTIKVE